MYFQNVAALIDNLRMSYLLQIDDFLETYKRVILATQSHYNGLLHLLSKSTPAEEKPENETTVEDQTFVDVTIEERPEEVEFSGLHL